MVLDWPPHPLHPNEDRRGYVLNLYVEPGYRGRGVARDLMRLADAGRSRSAASLMHFACGRRRGGASTRKSDGYQRQKWARRDKAVGA